MHAPPVPLFAAINHLLEQAAWARAKLVPFAGHSAQIKLPFMTVAFAVTEAGMLAAAPPDAAPEVVISLPAAAPLLALQGKDALMRAARLEGSADFAQALSDLMRNLRWDVEEDLSRWLGDIPAHRLISGAQALVAGQRRMALALTENLAEYFSEEQPMIARRAAIADFSVAVDRLRDDVARLEKRLSRLR
jgi:ubiquinone biosynthesis protein UbiJ